ncbi:T9SS type A sorting domain-containing protein [Hymenobacter sp. BT635]|uniref:T9SS type A sorting domain-containing protein n=1 Tax=Hymenobacter nitidus TaxID=2880929 RepID=A0ABS8AFG8_9BACT|nr:T9SS type A sorting domain-containing protein [Hymenobacter nitidus]MCB2378854.1 T9SS type A sorting domain-containing protein [Hymenobacter nitidus]
MRILTPAASTLLLGLINTVSYGQVYSLDPGFGTAGKATIAFPAAAATDVATSLVLQPDGKIVVAGQNNDSFGVARLTATGLPDATFGTAGTANTTFAPPLGASPTITIQYAQATTLLLQADGKLVAAGLVRSSGPSYRGYARYLPSGVLDTSFDGDGKVIPYNSEGSLGSSVTGLKQQADGKLLSIGRQMGLTGSVSSPLYRLETNGAADNTYTWTYPSAGPNSSNPIFDKTVSASAVDATGRLITAGAHFVSNQNYTGPQGPALVRYTNTGQPDATFGTDGLAILTAANGGSGLEWKKMALLPDGKILVGSLKVRGVGAQQRVDSVSIARYTANGTLDLAFGRRGLATTNFSGVAATNGQALSGLHVLPGGDITYGVLTDAGTFNVVQVSGNGRQVTLPSVIALPGLQVADMILQPDGKALLVGTQTDGAAKRFTVVRLTTTALLGTRGRLSDAQVQLFPNPAAQSITLRLAGIAESQSFKLQVFDVLGREVLAQAAARLVGGAVQLPLQTLRPGSYTLRAQGTDFTVTRQFVRTE